MKRPKDCCGRSSIPLELKILGTLRVLGRATCFDGIQELTGGSREVHRGFFHEFCEKFVERFYNSYIHPPKNAEEIEKTMEIYRRMGFNGAIGSTDCVHVRWDCCPAGLFNFCKGKEKFPSLVWLATVDHHMKFQSVSRSFYGATNDKTIIKMDKYFKDLRAGEYDLETGYSLFTEFGDPIVVYRPYLLCDPGFLNWEGLLSTYKYTPFVAEASFNAQLESIRKDIERAFGILKARFRCLKNPILLHDQSQIDNMFLTCCILHNLLLSIDGKDKMWQENEQWKEIDKEFDNYDDRTRATLRSRILRKTIDYSYVRNRMINPQGDLFDDERKEDGFYEMRKKVKEHFYWLYKHSYLEWLH